MGDQVSSNWFPKAEPISHRLLSLGIGFFRTVEDVTFTRTSFMNLRSPHISI